MEDSFHPHHRNQHRNNLHPLDNYRRNSLRYRCQDSSPSQSQSHRHRFLGNRFPSKMGSEFYLEHSNFTKIRNHMILLTWAYEKLRR